MFLCYTILGVVLVSFICNVDQVDGSSRWKGKGGYQRINSKGWLDKYGKVTNLNVISQVRLDSCEKECSKNAKCVGYTYITSRSRCDLKDKSGIVGGLKELDGLVSGIKVNRKDDCVVGDGSSYRGSTSTTQKGLTCQKWSSQSPNTHNYWTQDNRVNRGVGDHNHCRNPDGDSRPWCITATKGRQWWDYCDIPTCQTGPTGPGHQCPAGLSKDALGPFFIPNTFLPLFGDIAPPNQVDLYVEGVVYDSSCRPVPGAKVEVWHASPHKDGTAFYSCRPTPLTCTGQPCTQDVCAHRCIPGLCKGPRPDNRCSIGDQIDLWDESKLTEKLWYRGLDYTDKAGHYWYNTSFPGTYKVRPVPHIHYKVTYPGGKEMVTQLYFEGHNSDREQRNQVKEVVPVVPGFGRVTFHIYPENFENLRIASCPFNRSQQP